jgi:DNA polymerase-1
MLSFDYAQLELRFATAYAGEESLKEIFAEGRDLFTEMAAELGMTRPSTKTFVYSTQYGAGEKKTMSQFGVTQAVAAAMRNRYSAAYPRMAAFNEHCKMKAEQNLKVRIWTGRYRHFQYKSEGYKAMNSVIQGGSADIVERIMVKCYEETESDDCHMLLQVHDALVFEVRIGEEERYATQIKSIMEDINAVVPEHLNGLFDVRFSVEESPWEK